MLNIGNGSTFDVLDANFLSYGLNQTIRKMVVSISFDLIRQRCMELDDGTEI